MAVNVGLNLTPKRRARTASSKADALHRNVHFLEQSERIPQAEGNAFENGTNDVASGVRGGKAHQRAAGAAVKMRSAFAHEIRGPEQAIGTGRNSCSFGGEMIVGFRSASGIGSERVAEPAQRKPGRLRHTHDVPAAGNRVAKRVNATAGIERRTIRGGENDAGSANGGANGSGRDDAHADGAGSLIAGPRDDGSAGCEPAFCRASGGNFCTNIRGFVDER